MLRTGVKNIAAANLAVRCFLFFSFFFIFSDFWDHFYFFLFWKFIPLKFHFFAHFFYMIKIFSKMYYPSGSFLYKKYAGKIFCQLVDRPRRITQKRSLKNISGPIQTNILKIPFKKVFKLKKSRKKIFSKSALEYRKTRNFFQKTKTPFCKWT